MVPSVVTQVKEPPRGPEQLPCIRHTFSEEVGWPCLQPSGWVQPQGKCMLDQHTVTNVGSTDYYLLTFIMRGECFLISLKKKIKQDL